MSETDYVRLVVDSVQLTSSSYEDDYAVSKAYVDGVKSSIMGGLTSEALDTIKELSEYMNSDTVAGGLVSQLAAISTSVDDEVKRAGAAESAIDSRISSLEFNMESADGALSNRIDTLGLSLDGEVLRATAAESAVDGRVSSLETATENSLALKANLSGAAFSGDVQLSEDSYLQFGPRWRVKGDASGRRLVFEYKRADTWKTAIPFITSLN